CCIVATVDSGVNMSFYIIATTRSGVDNRMFLRKNSCSGKMSYCSVTTAIRQTKKGGQQTFAC
ncbi:hypothetical protein, partial [Segatella oulorum]|uniref:hypothetical protein n=1 Tax=Segatella oulorum TaxID=28136 RepID=UPI0036216DD8